MSTEIRPGRLLDREGIRAANVKWNLSAAALYEEAVRRQEAAIAVEGAPEKAKEAASKGLNALGTAKKPERP